MPKEGFKVISIRKETYNKIKKRAKKMTLTDFVDALVKEYDSHPHPTLPERGEDDLFIGSIWPGPYLAFVTDPQTTNYKSTAWIANEKYPDVVGLPQVDPSILDRIHRVKDKFKIEKMVIVSQQAWERAEVWAWIMYWFSLSVRYKRKLKLFVVHEKEIPSTVEKKHLDMGIYERENKEQEACAFLNLDPGWEHDKNKRQYVVHFDLSEIEKAKTAFEELKRHAMNQSNLFDQFRRVFGEENEP
jgi:hypothetical protein